MSSFPFFLQPDPLQQAIYTLQNELGDLFHVTRVVPQRRGDVIAFVGRLLHDSEGSYAEIERRFEVHGYTPLLRHENGEDVLVALAGLEQKANTGNPLVNLLLFLATVFTTLSAGAAMAGVNVPSALQTGSPAIVLESLRPGIPFALTLIGILGIHELGHYLAARRHGVAATLPYFIPMPVGGLGTLGAFISLKTPMKDRRVLFDIGLAGPVAGFLVALPLLLIGLQLSALVPTGSSGLTLQMLGHSLLTAGIVQLLIDVPPGMTLALNPVFFAAWLGLFLTGINLLPIGQLDGGHVTYAIFGRKAHTIAQLAFFLLLLAGLLVSSNWLIWALFLIFGGVRHPAPLNDITDLDTGRKWIGFLAILLFVLVIVPTPFN